MNLSNYIILKKYLSFEKAGFFLIRLIYVARCFHRGQLWTKAAYGAMSDRRMLLT
jgi:hypothetical protein